MEDKHREHIKRNVDKLINLTDYKDLISACVHKGLLTPQMRQNIENIESGLPSKLSYEDVQREYHKRLFLKITKRGPEAYQLLKQILSSHNYEKALQLLNEPRYGEQPFRSLNESRMISQFTQSRRYENGDSQQPQRLAMDSPGLSSDPSNSDNVLELKEFTGETEALFEVKKSDRLHQDNKVGTYPMNSRDKRGVLLLVNIIEFPERDKFRNGATKDSQSLLHLFKNLDFKIFFYESITKKKFFAVLDRLLASEYVRHTNCFSLILMSHGRKDKEDKDIVEFSDNSHVHVHKIVECFQSHKCPNLVNKPKILMFPFCRGEISDIGFFQNDKKLEMDGAKLGPQTSLIYNVPTLSDLIICFAALSGFNTHRDPENGSWYIQTFCEIMAAHAHDTSIDDILTMVGKEVERKRSEIMALQVANFISCGFKKLYLNPGYWEGK